MANVVTGTPDRADVAGAQRAGDLRDLAASENELNSLRTHGPGFPLIFLLPQISTQTLLGEGVSRKRSSTIARTNPASRSVW
jgi:hypothetical protein